MSSDGADVGEISRIISEDFKHGSNLKLGFGVIIEPDVIVGDNVKLGHRVTLKSGTRIGNNSVVDDHCITTGACIIGNNVNVRTGATISRATIIEDLAFIGPGVITNHTKHVGHGRPRVTSDPLITYIGFGAIIGSQVSILAGVYIAPWTIIGGGAVVVKDIYVHGVYVGSPALKKGKVPRNYRIENAPWTIGSMYAEPKSLNILVRYMSNLQIGELGTQIARYKMTK